MDFAEDPDHRLIREAVRAACARFSADEAARTCGKCGTVAAPLDLAAFGWPPADAAQP